MIPRAKKTVVYIPIQEYNRAMKITEFRSALEAAPDAIVRFTLPDDGQVPAHFHVTEVGYLPKKFIDCGGLTGATESCVLQTWLGDDDDNRLTAGRLAKILALGGKVLPHEDLEVEVEYDCCVISQYPVMAAECVGEHLEFTLRSKSTRCLACERRLAQQESNCCTPRPTTLAAEHQCHPLLLISMPEERYTEVIHKCIR